MNIKFLIILVVSVALVISITYILLHTSSSQNMSESITTPLGNETPTQTTSVETTTTETTTAPFRTRPLTTPTAVLGNVCEYNVLKITAVIRSKYVIQDSNESILLTGYIRIERAFYEEGVIVSVKNIVIDNPNEYIKKGFNILAEQLIYYFDEPRSLPFTQSIRIEIPFTPELYDLLKPGTEHVITVTYLYNNVECKQTVKVTMLSD